MELREAAELCVYSLFALSDFNRSILQQKSHNVTLFCCIVRVVSIVIISTNPVSFLSRNVNVIIEIIVVLLLNGGMYQIDETYKCSIHYFSTNDHSNLPHCYVIRALYIVLVFSLLSVRGGAEF